MSQKRSRNEAESQASEAQFEELDKSEERKILVFDYIKAFVTGLIMVVIVVLFRINGTKGFLFYTINGCFVAGVMLAGLGAITIINKAGFYDIAQYGLKKVFRVKSVMKGKDRMPIDFYDYKVERRSKRFARWHWVVSGIFYIALSIILIQFN